MQVTVSCASKLCPASGSACVPLKRGMSQSALYGAMLKSANVCFPDQRRSDVDVSGPDQSVDSAIGIV